MDNTCIRCGKPAAYSIHALEIRTLHVRSLSGERRIQALGDEKTGGICEACAREQLALTMDVRHTVRPQLIRFGAVLLAGLLITAAAFIFLKGQAVFVLLGAAAAVCGILGIADAYRNARDKTRSLRSLPEADALEVAAWDMYVSQMPQKEKENDLTYIPINQRSLKRKNGDLMVLYHLLPEIAVEAWNKLHENKEDNP